jgi:phospholipid/cholesterol/gamma-HCH transport system ATP-binding protein
MSAPADIELVGVDVTHEDDPGIVLVRDVNWRIERGDWWVVCGGPASGKTSLLSTAAGLTPAVGGELSIFGRGLAEATEQEQVAWRRHIGFVFEGGGRLFGSLSVLENVLLPLQYHGDLDPREARQRAEGLLALAGLTEYGGLLPSRLGTALQRRAGLARALSIPVRVLFVDNPLAGLARSDARWWLEFLTDLAARRAAAGDPLAIVASAFDFGDWLERANHFAVIEGRGFHVLDDPEAISAYREGGGLAGPARSSA